MGVERVLKREEQKCQEYVQNPKCRVLHFTLAFVPALVSRPVFIKVLMMKEPARKVT